MTERLANFFVYHRLREKYGWTFEYFRDRYLRGGFRHDFPEWYRQ